MASNDIRARVDSFWPNSIEAELLGCIAHALADVAECLEDIRGLLQPAPAHFDLRDHSDAGSTRKLQPMR
jgi:hypothetical protein